MPPRINAAGATKFAQVDPTFIEMMKQIWKERWGALNDEIKYAPPPYKKLKAQKSAPIMSRPA